MVKAPYLDRLRKEYVQLQKSPPPHIRAVPLAANILEWHYVISGLESCPYEGGYYHGKLIFPREYPYKPPGIMMITPNGRFKVHTRLCLSMSDFHPDQWNPAWSVESILKGLLSFMLENTPTAGSISTTEAQKRRFALESGAVNLKSETFKELFPEVCDEIREHLRKVLAERGHLQPARATPADEALSAAGGQGTLLNVFVVVAAIACFFVISAVVNSTE